jgi:hypothetical protein
MKLLLLSAMLLAAAPAQARPVVVELFTSEACSSCPPAEALLAELKTSDAGILPLSFHITYWNGPAWNDKFALVGATDRQGWYAGLQHSQDVYTPEAVVDGVAAMVGSNRGAVTSAISAAKSAAGTEVPVSVSGDAMLKVKIGDGAAAPAKIWLFGFDSAHSTQIGGGENDGERIAEVNVVRSITALGAWNGIPITFTMPKPAGEHMAVLLQKDDGTILGAASD